MAHDLPNIAWSPDSWRNRPAAQQPVWPDDSELKRVHAQLSGLPPLVFAGEARHLTRGLGEAAAGRAFVLQAGDCAESFTEFSADSIRDKLKVILQMAVVLTYGAGVPVIKLGRIAGQFAKPRSSPTEQVGDQVLDSFRGHMVNDDLPEKSARVPDPNRLVAAYQQSVSTLNLLRAFTKGGFADLSQIHQWNQEFVASSTEGQQFEDIAQGIDRALRFMAACGINLTAEDTLHEVDFWTSHEALILDYEEALTRRDSLTDQWYDCSAHMLWVGERTRQLDGAHCEFLSGIRNPVGSEGRTHGHPRRCGLAVRTAQSRSGPRPPDSDHPLGRRRGSKPDCPRSWRRSGRRATRWCGCATPCTATPSLPREATRRGGSTTSSVSSVASSPPTARWAPGRAACTSS